MVIFDGKLVATSFDRTSIYTIDSSDNVTTVPLPTDYLIGASYLDFPAYVDYNTMAVVGSLLYVIAENQVTSEFAILRTSDLSIWERMASTNEKLISISYWPNTSWLVTSTAGMNARLLRLNLIGNPTSVSVNEISAFPSSQRSSSELLIGSCIFGIAVIWLFRKIRISTKSQT
jgi:hypothetical protein